MPAIAFDQIETVLNGLPTQNRTMIRLLLLQYFDIPDDEIEYMAIDQPDSRFMSGEQPEVKHFTREAVEIVGNRARQYQLFLHQKRERPGLQVDCLQQLVAQTEAEINVAERLLTDECSVNQTAQNEAKTQAPTTLVKQVSRQLARSIEQKELSEEDYTKKRLLLEYQLLIRRQARQRRRLVVAKQEFQLAGSVPLQDHEIAHIWGLPLGSLVGRKVKALHQYLLGLQEHIQGKTGKTDQEQSPGSDVRPDYWQQTFLTLSKRPVVRSVVAYSGQERTEEALMEKLEALANRRMSEEEETQFWAAITKIHDSEHSGMWISHDQAIFALQRLSAILKEFDNSAEAIEEDLRARIAPPVPPEQRLEPEQPEQEAELSEEALGVLQKLVGELDDKRAR